MGMGPGRRHGYSHVASGVLAKARAMIERLNASEYLLDRRLDAGDGDRVALRCPDVALTYAEVAAQADQVAHALVGLGVRPEERVPIVLCDSPEWVAAFLGTLRVGAVAVPMSTMLMGDDLAFLCNDARARVAIADAALGQAVAGMAAGAAELEHLVLTGEGDVIVPRHVATHRFAQWAVGDKPFTPYATWPDSPAFWLYTSGTTGQPKGAMHRHADLPFTAQTYGQQVLGITRSDRVYSVAKLFFAYGLGNSLTFPFSVGACTALDPGCPTPAGVARAVKAAQPTLFFAVPTFYGALLASPVPTDTFASVRYAISAGEPLPAGIFRRFKARFGVEILDGIGTTEALHIFISNAPGDIHPGRSGRLVPGFDAKLLDDNGQPVPDGKPGHLYVCGESIATGYWCRTEVTRQTFLGPWLRTGDVFSRSEDGVYTYGGRSDDMLKAGGIWVCPAEVEATLLTHPGILEAAVVGRPDEFGNDKPVAFVVAAPGQTPTADELITLCAQRLASFKRPRDVVFCDELPKTATGKIQRFKLRGRADRRLRAARNLDLAGSTEAYPRDD
jgi:benzoate-CoA ligase family protein